MLCILAAFTLMLINIGETTGQNLAQQNILQESKKAYGSNDFIMRGLVYIPQHPKANEHPYFLNAEWNEANINLLGEKFQHIKLKYNVAEQIVIIQKNEENNHTKQPIILNTTQIDRFELEGHLLTNLQHFDSVYQLQGFGEVVYSGQIQLIRKHTKTFVNQYNKTNPYGYYTKLQSNFYLLKAGESIRIYNKRSLINAFPGSKKQLKKKLRELQFRFKKATDEQWNEIISWCEKQL